MSNPLSQRVRLSYRKLIAVISTTVYLLIVMTPLAPLAMHSKIVAHAMTGECSGDCSICGCSLESRANQTCCCAKKKQLHEREHEDDGDTPECCRKKQAQITIVRCGCPCDDHKQIVLSTNGTSEVLPFQFTESLSIPHTDTTFSNSSHRLTSRHLDPPDTPPQLS
jgi:hypothetical protein